MISRQTLLNILLTPILAASTAWSGVPDMTTCCRQLGVPSHQACRREGPETATPKLCCCRGRGHATGVCACRVTKIPAAPCETATSGRQACDWFTTSVPVDLSVAEIANVRISHSHDRLAGNGTSSRPVHAQLCNWRI